MSAATIAVYATRWVEVFRTSAALALLKAVRDDVAASAADKERLRLQTEAFALVLQFYISNGEQQRDLLALIESEAGQQLATEVAETELLSKLRKQHECLRQELQQAANALGASRDLIAELERLQARKKELEKSIAKCREGLAQAHVGLCAMEDIAPVLQGESR